MKLARNYYNPSNSKNFWKETARDLQDELNFYEEETWKQIDSRTRTYKKTTRQKRAVDLKHHRIK